MCPHLEVLEVRTVPSVAALEWVTPAIGATVGETVSLQARLTLAEGPTDGGRLTVNLPSGLVFRSLDALGPHAALTTSHLGGFEGVAVDALVPANGASVALLLDNLVNSDTDPATAESVDVSITAVVLNTAANQAGTALVPQARFSFTGGLLTAAGPAVTVVEPDLALTLTPSAPGGDAGATLTFTLVVSHRAASGADAFDLALRNALPAGLVPVTGSLRRVSGRTPTSLALTGSTVTATYDQLPVGQSSTLEFRATLAPSALPGQTQAQAATLTFTSRPGDGTTPLSDYSPLSTERTGDPSQPGGAANDYTTSATAEVAVFANTLAGSVYVDADNDGVRDADERGVGGALVTLTGTDHRGTAVERTVATDGAGAYAFAELRPGTYTLREVQPAGLLDGRELLGVPTLGATAGDDVIGPFTIPTGGVTLSTGHDFGEVPPASVAGRVFLDANNDGSAQPSEGGLPGAALSLTGTDDRGTAVSVTSASGPNGLFLFPNLRPGSYALSHTPPSGHVDGRETPGTAGGRVTDGRIEEIVLAPGAAAADYLFADLLPARLSGAVYLDADDDGRRDADEPGLPGVTVTLVGATDRGGLPPLAAVSGPDGAFHFADLRPGTYTLVESHPSAYTDGRETAGSAGGSAAAEVIGDIVLVSGTHATGYLFGERGAVLSGSVYVDADADGRRDPEEVGLPGSALTLADISGTTLATAVSAADGSYTFANLGAGAYRLIQTQPLGYGSSTPDTLPVALTVLGLSGVDFGESVSSLAGAVYLDADGDGLRGSTDPGIAGVVVTLTGTDATGAAVDRTATTGADGTYRFVGLLAGTYAIREVQPTAYLDGPDTVGDIGGTRGDDVVSAIRLGPGQNGVGYDFGERASGISGMVFLDADGDGRRGTGESGQPGVVVTLVDAVGSVLGTATTGPDGSFAFEDLPAGTYELRETQPIGYGSSTPDVLRVELTTAGLAEQRFGNTTSLVSGEVFLDGDNSGTRGVAEVGLEGIALTLSGTDATGTTIRRTAVTGADGTFRIAGLLAGSYALTWSLPAEFLPGTIGDTELLLGPGATAPAFVLGALPAALPDGLRYASVFDAFDLDFALPRELVVPSELGTLASSHEPGGEVLTAALFVDGVYRQMLGRSADATGLAFWVRQLQLGLPRAAFAQALGNSAEHRARQVDLLYQTFLGAGPDVAGGAFWTSALQKGVSTFVLARALLASDTYAADHLGDDAVFVTGLYADVLGRRYDAEGLAYWVGQLRTGASRAAVASVFLGSETAFLDVVAAGYADCLRRELGAAEAAAWSGVQRAGVSADLVATALFASDEFYARARRRSLE